MCFNTIRRVLSCIPIGVAPVVAVGGVQLYLLRYSGVLFSKASPLFRMLSGRAIIPITSVICGYDPLLVSHPRHEQDTS